MAQALSYESAPVPLLAKLGPRIDSLDLLRGFAILGIFLMNTWTISMPQQAYTNPASYSPNWVQGQGFPAGSDTDGTPIYDLLQPLTGLNYYVFVIIHLLADMKFITTFSILFGAGILLQGERAGIRGRNPWAVHYSRMAILLLFGLLHAYLLWYGDILTEYALCGIILFPLRRLPPALLTFVGMLMIVIAAFIGLAYSFHWNEPVYYKSTAVIPGLPFNHWDVNPLSYFDQIDIKYYEGGIDKELTAYRNGYHAEMKHRVAESLRSHLVQFPTWTLFRCGGCMLLGMALQKRRFFHGTWPKEAYAAIAGIVIPIGWMISYLGVLYNDHNGWEDGRDFSQLWGLGVQFNYWGSLLCAFGYISFGVLLALWAADPARKLLSTCLIPIRAVGRMALSNYISQTLIATTIFYGHGYGYFGHLSRAQLLPIVFITWVAQLLLSTLWLQFFRQGPLEYLWHSLVYWTWKSPLLPHNLPPGPPTLETSI